MIKLPKSVKPKSGVKGMDIILSNLNKEIKAIKGRTMAGMLEAAILVRRDMDETPPLIPVDTGNLRASWTVTSIRNEKGFGVRMGFTANYAIYVHEMMDNSGTPINWSRPDSGPKFFQASIKRNEKEILRVIGENAQIK